MGRSKLWLRESIYGYMFISPMAIGFLLFVLGPVLIALAMSFTDWRVIGDVSFVGLANYTHAFKTDSLYWITFWNTLYYTLGVVQVEVELWDMGRSENYIPHMLQVRDTVAVQPGRRQWVKFRLPWTPAQPQNAFVIVKANPHLSLYLADKPQTGTLSFVKQSKANISSLLTALDNGQPVVKWSMKPVVRKPFCVRLLDKTDAFLPDKILDGRLRPYGGPGMWLSAPMREGREEWVELQSGLPERCHCRGCDPVHRGAASRRPAVLFERQFYGPSQSVGRPASAGNRRQLCRLRLRQLSAGDAPPLDQASSDRNEQYRNICFATRRFRRTCTIPRSKCRSSRYIRDESDPVSYRMTCSAGMTSCRLCWTISASRSGKRPICRDAASSLCSGEKRRSTSRRLSSTTSSDRPG